MKLVNRSQVQAEILSEDPATALLWTFKINRRARVPKGWSCWRARSSSKAAI
ncbi:MAG: hypothetical protein U0521_17395 [Anaerolineae bacterium]